MDEEQQVDHGSELTNVLHGHSTSTFHQTCDSCTAGANGRPRTMHPIGVSTCIPGGVAVPYVTVLFTCGTCGTGRTVTTPAMPDYT